MLKNFAGKNLRMTQEKLQERGFNKKKKAWRGVLKINAYAAAKHKIIFSWPNEKKPSFPPKLNQFGYLASLCYRI